MSLTRGKTIRAWSTILRYASIIVCTFAVFLVCRKLIGATGRFPKTFADLYAPSVFIKTGTFVPAMIGLNAAILVLLISQFRLVQIALPGRPWQKGLLYGASFGLLWFIAFFELIFVYGSEHPINHIFSGLRDLCTLSSCGLLAGLLFGEDRPKIDQRERESPFSILVVAAFFSLGHFLQYAVTFPGLTQEIDKLDSILWLTGLGLWIGFQYYLFSPGLRGRNLLFRNLHFSVLVFGSNWLLYNSFYALFLDIPLWGIFIRCFAGVLGVFVGSCLLKAFDVALEKAR